MTDKPDITIEQFPVIEYDPTEAAIADLKVKYMPLTIGGIDDRKGYKVVDEARRHVKSLRCAVENRRKEMKAPAVEWGRRVDAKAKEITAALQPIEDHLVAEQKQVDDEKARIEAERQTAVAAMVKARVEELEKYGYHVLPETARDMTEEQYQGDLATAKAAWEMEQAQKERERQAKEAEEARLAEVAKQQAEEQARLERERQEQAKREAALRAEEKRLAEKQRQAEAAKQVPEPQAVIVEPPVLAPVPTVNPIPVIEEQAQPAPKPRTYPHIWIVVGEEGRIYLGANTSWESAEHRLVSCQRDMAGTFEVVEYGPVGEVRS